MPTLVLANKLYSSWSLRPWLLMTELGIPFDEIVIPLDQPDTRGAHSEALAGRARAGPDRRRVTVWDSLSIFEYVAERFGKPVWPQDRKARALARSISAEMHSGFTALRSACPMNLGKKYAARDRGEAVARTSRASRRSGARASRHGAGGPFLFGAFSAADAMYAPVVTRFEAYSIPVEPISRAYMDAILSLTPSPNGEEPPSRSPGSSPPTRSTSRRSRSTAKPPDALQPNGRAPMTT